MKRLAALILALSVALWGAALGEVSIMIMDSDGGLTAIDEAADTGEADGEADGSAAVGDAAARDDFIGGITDLAQALYEKANGRAQRAQYSSDIYVCKNFTVYLFRQNADKYRMAEYPDTELKIPDNKPKKECKEYVYGVEWKDVPASDGNPFEAAASFRYDPDMSAAENREAARDFLKQVKKGDYFQMAAKYYYGTGAHSLVFIADYDEATDSVRWCDSNMKGEKRNGERYGYVQFDAVKEIDWFVEAFCRPKYGATLYRLRDDIIYAP